MVRFKVQPVFLFIIAVIGTCVHGQGGLREYADKIGLNIGTCVFGRTYQTNQDYNKVLLRDFNTIVAENEMKASAMQPQKGQFSFGTADAMVAFAQENNMKVRGHTLVWHAQNPSWLSGGTWTRETLLEQMRLHIEGVVGHFKGKVFEWDVVNEAFSDFGSGGLRGSFWQRTIGDDFLDSAFTYAHHADPDAILYYNDYNTSNVNAKSTAVYNRIRQMVENGIPISGIGFQSHQTLEEYTPEFIESLRENFDRFAKLGLNIAVTELDIRITLPSDQDDLDKQGEYYREYLETFLANPACKTFMIWGFTDRYSWIPGTFQGTGEALLYTNSYQPKPAYNALLAVLENFEPEAVLPGSGVVSKPYTIRNGTSGAIFNLLGAKIGSYAVSSGVRPVANQAVIAGRGVRPRVLVK